MTDALLDELAVARRTRRPCALITVAATNGSVPRAAGSKMLVYLDGASSGTIGGGKFESLVLEEAAALSERRSHCSRHILCTKAQLNLSAPFAAER